MRNIPVFLIIFFVPLYSIGQSFRIGISSGVTYNYLNRTLNQPLTVTKGKLGFVGGARLTYTSNQFVIEFLPEYVNKFYSLIRTDTLTGLYTYFNNSYLQNSIFIGHKCAIRKVSMIFGVGAFHGFWLRKIQESQVLDIYNSKVKINGSTAYQNFTPIHYKETIDFNKNIDNRHDVGFLIGYQVEYNVKLLSIGADLRFSKSLIDQIKPNNFRPDSRTNNTVSFQIFLCIKL